MPAFSRSPISPSSTGAAFSSGVSIGPGRDGVDAHAVARGLARDRAREADHARLGRRVDDRALRADAARLGGDVDDRAAAALAACRRQHRVRDGDRAAQVDAEDEVPQRLVGVDEEGEAVGAGVVDEHVDRAELALGLRRPPDRHRRRVGDVELRRARPSISPATSRAPSRSRSATATRAPSAASRRAVAAPIPDAPPVTSAIRPSSRMAAQPIRPPPRMPRCHGRRSSARPARSASGLALRLAAAGVPVVIGSRDAGRAQEAAARVTEQVPAADVRGLANGPAAAAREIVFLCVPFRNQSETLHEPQEPPRAKASSLVDATVPLAAAVSGKATRMLGVWQGSAAQQAAEMVPRRRPRRRGAAHRQRPRRSTDLDAHARRGRARLRRPARPTSSASPTLIDLHPGPARRRTPAGSRRRASPSR